MNSPPSPAPMPPNPLPHVPWGLDDSIELGIPLRWMADPPELVWPKSVGSIDNYPVELERSLDTSENSPGIEELVGPRSKVAIIVDDPSRWTPVRDALPVVLRRLHSAGIGIDDVTISVGVGRHIAVDEQSMRKRVGAEVATKYRCFSPPVDDLSAYTDLGATPEGIPVRVFRPVAEADLRILIGSVLPHLQAGFGGGYKLIFPGTSHRETLGALHRQGIGRGSNPGRLLGSQAEHNPMRQAIHSAAKLLGPCFSISHLIGGPGEIVQIATGDPQAVQNRLASEAKRRFRAPDAPPADIVVAGNNPWPGDPMQSFKVLLQHRAACRRGGVLVGLFWTDPTEIDRSFPLGMMRAIASTGALGGWAIRQLLPAAGRVTSAFGSKSEFMIRWACELVVDRTVLVYAPPLREAIGPRLGPVSLFDDLGELWKAAARSLRIDDSGGPSPAIRIFPRGGLTYAPQVALPDGSS